MKNILHRNHILASVLSLFILASCSSSENTIVIEEAPISSGQPDTTTQATGGDEEFSQLTIGENQPIKTLDPLFVENGSGMRALQLVFEGLVRFNTTGEIIPAIAKDWAITNNGQTYRFMLHSDIFYHDSNIFPNGRGRRLVADDVKKAFERMARATVSHRAAQLFMNIKGFEPYYREQQAVLLPGEGQVEGISGIRTPNDSTVVFSLVQPDDTFLNKLATPYGVIYPPEAITDSGFKAVGTGPFRLSQKQSDSLYIFAKYQGYRIPNQPRIDRVDIRTSNNETALLNALSRGDVQLIPQLGPEQIQMVSNNNGELRNSLAPSLRLIKFDKASNYKLQYNTGADISREIVSQALSQVQDTSFFSSLPSGTVEFNWKLSISDTSAQPVDSLTSSYSSDPFVRSFYSTLANRLANDGVTLTMQSSPVANRNTELFTTHTIPIQEGSNSRISDNILAAFTTDSWIILSSKINDIEWNSYPWWVNLREATLSSTNTR